MFKRHVHVYSFSLTLKVTKAARCGLIPISRMRKSRLGEAGALSRGSQSWSWTPSPGQFPAHYVSRRKVRAFPHRHRAQGTIPVLICIYVTEKGPFPEFTSSPPTPEGMRKSFLQLSHHSTGPSRQPALETLHPVLCTQRNSWGSS